MLCKDYHNKAKVEEAKNALFKAEEYMEHLGREFERLRDMKITDSQVNYYIEQLLPMNKNMTILQRKNNEKQREDLASRYFDAPDLKFVGKNAYRFINAVSDFATHAEPLRKTANYKENLFGRTMEGIPMLDKAYQMVCAA